MGYLLSGIRVIDLSRLAPGPFCTMLLADMGCEVIKVERIGEERIIRPKLEKFAPMDSPLERNKRSICIDLKSDKGREVFYRLVKDAKVVVEGFRPGVAGRLGIDFETVKKINPDIVYCSISGYGQDGPYRELPGHDINYISASGVLGLIGEEKPSVPLNLVADYAGGGLFGAIAILAALLSEKKPIYIDLSMTDCSLSLLTHLMGEYFLSKEPVRRMSHMLQGVKPYYTVYRTKDGFISVGCIERHFWENLLRALGREELLEEDEDRVRRELEDIFITKTRDEWFEYLKDKNVCVMKVYDMEEVPRDPQLRERGMFWEINGYPQVGFPVKFSGVDFPKKAPPLPGENTREILGELGYSEEEIKSLFDEKVVG